MSDGLTTLLGPAKVRDMNWDEIAKNLIATLGTLETLGADKGTEIPTGIQELIDSVQQELAVNW